MKKIKRESITDELYRLVLDTETHHNHDIIEDDNGVLRWAANPDIIRIMENISMNDLSMLLIELGYDQNSEIYRKLYRDIGYSLYGYWEVFYWEVNNEKAYDYVPNAK